MTTSTNNGFEIDRGPGTFESKGLIRRQQKKGNNEASPTVHKLRAHVDVFSGDLTQKMLTIFPGSDQLAKAIAAVEGRKQTIVAGIKLGVVAVTVRDFAEGNVLFTDPIARGGIPRLIIGEAAKTSHLQVDLEVAIPRDKAGLIVDYFKNDVMISIAQSQLEIADAVADADEDDGEDEPDDSDDALAASAADLFEEPKPATTRRRSKKTEPVAEIPADEVN